LLFEQMLNRGAIELALRGFGRGEPGISDGARPHPVSIRVVGVGRVDELVGYDWAFERGDDVAKRELARISRELVAAVWPAHGADNADSPQATQELIEVGLGNFLAGSNFGALHRALAEASGKLDDGVSAIVAAHGESHGSES
jgi:hypothetical protein